MERAACFEFDDFAVFGVSGRIVLLDDLLQLHVFGLDLGHKLRHLDAILFAFDGILVPCGRSCCLLFELRVVHFLDPRGNGVVCVLSQDLIDDGLLNGRLRRLEGTSHERRLSELSDGAQANAGTGGIVSRSLRC